LAHFIDIISRRGCVARHFIRRSTYRRRSATTAVPTAAAPLAIEEKAEPTFEPLFSAFSVVWSYFCLRLRYQQIYFLKT
jgi:hypothetical protein